MIYIDFEYRGDSIEVGKSKIVRPPESQKDLVALAYRVGAAGETNAINLQTEDGFNEALEFLVYNRKDTFVSYNANAEIGCMLTMGIDVSDYKFIDLMVEAKMVKLTYKGGTREFGGLLSDLIYFGVIDNKITQAQIKDDTRNLIIENQEYSPEQWVEILDYAKSDVTCMPELLKKIVMIHNQVGTVFSYVENNTYLKDR